MTQELQKGRNGPEGEFQAVRLRFSKLDLENLKLGPEITNLILGKINFLFKKEFPKKISGKLIFFLQKIYFKRIIKKRFLKKIILFFITKEFLKKI